MVIAKTTKTAKRPKRLTDAEIDAQIPAAIAREKAAVQAGLRARSARYDAVRQLVVLELTNDCVLSFPKRLVKGLERATPAAIAAVQLDPGGSAVLWERLNTDYSIQGLIQNIFGPTFSAGALGAVGGRVRSDAKVTAARKNGRKGGRPRGPRVSKTADV